MLPTGRLPAPVFRGPLGAGLVETMKFMIHHLKTCDPHAFVVRCDQDGDGEYLSRPDTDFIPAMVGTFPLSEDWERVAAASDITEFDRRWSAEQQAYKEADAAGEDQ